MQDLQEVHRPKNNKSNKVEFGGGYLSGKRLLLLSLCTTLFLCTALLHGCSDIPASTTIAEATTTTTAAKKIELRFAHNWTNGDTKAAYFEPMLRQYARLHRDTVEFVFETTSKMDHKHKIRVDVASGKTPDIFTYWAGSPFASLVEAGVLANLDEYFEASAKTRLGMFEPGMFDSLTFDDSIYGIPYEVYKSFLLVNRELFKKAGIDKYPETIEELISISPKFNKIGVIPASWTCKNGDPSHSLYSSFLFQFAGEYENSTGIAKTLAFKNSNVIRAAETITALRKANAIPEDTLLNGGDEGSLTLYNQEKAAMMLAFPWMIQMIEPEISAKSDIISVPRLAGAEIDPDTFCVGAVSMGIAVNKESFADTSKKNEIVHFIDFLISDEMFKELAKSGMFPTKKISIDPSTVPGLYLRVDEATRDKELRLNHGKLFPNDEVLNVYLDSLDKLFAGAASAEEFVKAVQGALDKVK